MACDEFKEFCAAVTGTYENVGPAPKIGSFDPKFGDIGIDSEGRFHMWTGENWHPPVQA